MGNTACVGVWGAVLGLLTHDTTWPPQGPSRQLCLRDTGSQLRAPLPSLCLPDAWERRASSRAMRPPQPPRHPPVSTQRSPHPHPAGLPASAASAPPRPGPAPTRRPKPRLRRRQPVLSGNRLHDTGKASALCKNQGPSCFAGSLPAPARRPPVCFWFLISNRH